MIIKKIKQHCVKVNKMSNEFNNWETVVKNAFNERGSSVVDVTAINEGDTYISTSIIDTTNIDNTFVTNLTNDSTFVTQITSNLKFDIVESQAERDAITATEGHLFLYRNPSGGPDWHFDGYGNPVTELYRYDAILEGDVAVADYRRPRDTLVYDGDLNPLDSDLDDEWTVNTVHNGQLAYNGITRELFVRMPSSYITIPPTTAAGLLDFLTDATGLEVGDFSENFTIDDSGAGTGKWVKVADIDTSKASKKPLLWTLDTLTDLQAIGSPINDPINAVRRAAEYDFLRHGDLGRLDGVSLVDAQGYSIISPLYFFQETANAYVTDASLAGEWQLLSPGVRDEHPTLTGYSALTDIEYIPEVSTVTRNLMYKEEGLIVYDTTTTTYEKVVSGVWDTISAPSHPVGSMRKAIESATASQGISRNEEMTIDHSRGIVTMCVDGANKTFRELPHIGLEYKLFGSDVDFGKWRDYNYKAPKPHICVVEVSGAEVERDAYLVLPTVTYDGNGNPQWVVANATHRLTQNIPKVKPTYYVAADITARDALVASVPLTSANDGEICIVIDTGSGSSAFYVFDDSKGAGAGDKWHLLNLPETVSSVNTKIGDVVLTTDDVEEGTLANANYYWQNGYLTADSSLNNILTVSNNADKKNSVLSVTLNNRVSAAGDNLLQVVEASPGSGFSQLYVSNTHTHTISDITNFTGDVRSQISATGDINYNPTTGVISAVLPQGPAGPTGPQGPAGIGGSEFFVRPFLRYPDDADAVGSSIFYPNESVASLPAPDSSVEAVLLSVVEAGFESYITESVFNAYIRTNPLTGDTLNVTWSDGIHTAYDTMSGHTIYDEDTTNMYMVVVDEIGETLTLYGRQSGEYWTDWKAPVSGDGSDGDVWLEFKSNDTKQWHEKAGGTWSTITPTTIDGSLLPNGTVLNEIGLQSTSDNIYKWNGSAWILHQTVTTTFTIGACRFPTIQTSTTSATIVYNGTTYWNNGTNIGSSLSTRSANVNYPDNTVGSMPATGDTFTTKITALLASGLPGAVGLASGLAIALSLASAQGVSANEVEVGSPLQIPYTFAIPSNTSLENSIVWIRETDEYRRIRMCVIPPFVYIDTTPPPVVIPKPKFFKGTVFTWSESVSGPRCPKTINYDNNKDGALAGSTYWFRNNYVEVVDTFSGTIGDWQQITSEYLPLWFYHKPSYHYEETGEWKYFTQSRARQSLIEGNGINYDVTTGEINVRIGDGFKFTPVATSVPAITYTECINGSDQLVTAYAAQSSADTLDLDLGNALRISGIGQVEVFLRSGTDVASGTHLLVTNTSTGVQLNVDVTGLGNDASLITSAMVTNLTTNGPFISSVQSLVSTLLTVNDYYVTEVVAEPEFTVGVTSLIAGWISGAGSSYADLWDLVWTIMYADPANQPVGWNPPVLNGPSGSGTGEGPFYQLMGDIESLSLIQNQHKEMFKIAFSQNEDAMAKIFYLFNKIADNELDISELRSDVDGIVDFQPQIDTINGTLTSLQSQITSNDGDIVSLQGQINTNATLIAGNTNSISNVSSNLTALTSRVTTAENNITNNDSDIAALQGQATTFLIQAANNQIAIGNNVVAINANASNISTNASNLSALTGTVNNNTSSINTLRANVNALNANEYQHVYLYSKFDQVTHTMTAMPQTITSSQTLWGATTVLSHRSAVGLRFDTGVGVVCSFEGLYKIDVSVYNNPTAEDLRTTKITMTLDFSTGTPQQVETVTLMPNDVDMPQTHQYSFYAYKTEDSLLTLDIDYESYQAPVDGGGNNTFRYDTSVLITFLGGA